MSKEDLEKEAKVYANAIERKASKEIVKIAYMDAAEPREKRIADLEQKLEQTEKDLADYQFNYPTIKELEKENAQAKEIIKKLLILKNDHFGNTKMEWRVEVTEQAEQFLKEE